MHESKMEGYRSTRERLITEAMRLFSAKGFEATSVSQIEAAAGLAFGSGALYRHFKSKDALLDAGIDRQLDRRHSMRDIRALFVGLGDLHSELTVLGRYILSVIDDELQPLQIAARAPAGHSARLDTAYAAFIDGLNSELGDWIGVWAPSLPEKTG
jgi:AcrR family transcriptional regulator